MFSKIAVLFAVLVAVNATGLLNLHHAVPVSKTVVSTHYAAPVVSHYAAPVVSHYAAPVLRTYAAPVLKTYAAPVVVAHAPVGYSKSYFNKYHVAKHAVAPIYSHVAPVVHGYSTSTVVKHAAPVVVAHAAPLAVGHVTYSNGYAGHGLLGHRLGGIVYNGHKSIHY